MNEDSLVAVKTEKEHVGDVRFAHEKMRAKIGTDNSPHVCPVFRVKGRNSNQDLFRANSRSPLQDLHDFESDHRSKTQPPALPLLPGAQAPASLPRMPFWASLPRASEPHFLPEAASLLTLMPPTRYPQPRFLQSPDPVWDHYGMTALG